MMILFASVTLAPSTLLYAQASSDPFPSRVSYWKDASSGSWFSPDRWEEMRPPIGRRSGALLALKTPYEVIVPIDLELADLYLLNPDATIGIDARTDLSIFGRLVNHGTIEINTANRSGITRLMFNSDTHIGGDGSIILRAKNSTTESQILTGGHLVTIGHGQTVSGNGMLRGRYLNLGHSLVAEPGGPGLDIQQSVSQAPQGVFTVQASTLRLTENASIQGGQFHLGDHGTLWLETGATIVPDQTTIGAGTTISINNGEVVHPFPDLPIDLLLVESNDAICLLDRDMTLSGTVQLRPGAILSPADDVGISGLGSIQLIGDDIAPINTSGIRTIGKGTLTIAPGIDVFGSGFIDGGNGAIINHSVIRTVTSADTIELRGRVGDGSFLADSGTLSISNSAELVNAYLQATNGGSIIVKGGELINPTVAPGTNLLLSGNTITLTGRVTLQGDIILDRGDLNFNSTPLLKGTGRILMNSTAAREVRLIGAMGIPPGITVEGAGEIDGIVGNDSVITANNPTLPLTLDGIHDGGLYVAENALMRLLGDHYNGEYLADGGTIHLVAARVYNSQLRRVNGGSIILLPGSHLGLTNTYAEADLEISALTECTLQGEVELHGSHLIRERGCLLLEDTTLSGSGNIVMQGNPMSTQQPCILADEDIGHINEGFTIRGSGIIFTTENGAISSDSPFIADDPLEPLKLSGNIGPVIEVVADNAVLLLSNGLQLSETSIRSINGGVVNLSEGTLEFIDVTNFATIRIDNGNSNLRLIDRFENHGDIHIGATQVGGGASVLAPNPLEIMGQGTIHLEPQPSLPLPTLTASQSLIIGSGQSILGSGRLSGNIDVSGTLDPGASTRYLQFTNLELKSDARLVIDIDGFGPENHDTLRATGTASRVTLGGSLLINFGNGSTPHLADRWTVVQGNQITGRFNQILSEPPLKNGWVFAQVIHADGLDIVITCPGDRNGDGERNFFDVIDFITEYANLSGSADINEDGIVNFFDVGAFIEQFSSECPA